MSESLWTGNAGSAHDDPARDLCRRFAHAWELGQRPRVEDYLANLPEPARTQTLRALLLVEVRQRQTRGEPVDLHDYQERFPAHAELVRAVFLQVLGSAGQGTNVPESSQLTAVDTGPYRPRGQEADIPAALGRYRITARLGAGAFGVVYLGYDEELRREVAIKVPHRHRVASAEDVERYLTEARILASLDHPGIVPVYDVGRSADGLCHIVSKLVPGSDLKTRLAQGPIPLPEAVALVAGVAEALHHAHQRGLVHRDIKPANILLDAGGKAVVADFGLALREEEPGREGGLTGTPQYMSPEQARGGGRVDARTDIFSLGVVFYELLTGRRPFPGERMSEVLHEILTAEPPPPGQVNPRVPHELERICQKALAKDLLERYPTARELAAELRHWLAAQAASPAPPPDSDSGDAARPSSAIDPLKISVSRMPVTSRHLFGRDDQLGLLDSFWLTARVNVVTLVAWGGVGKTALMNAWLRRLADKQYGGAQCVYAWSFYSQGTRERAGAGDLFVQSALAWFGDPAPLAGTAWQKGERLARLIKRQRTLLLLDGLEPLQFPPGPQEGRIKDQAVQALLRELAASNPGLCLVSSRLPLTDLEEFEGGTVRPIELEHVPPPAGASLLRALGVKGDDAELEQASREFGGHCLALTLLGSYLTDAFDGEVEQRHAVGPLEHDVRAGGHAWRVMKSYESWFVGQPEVQLLRVLGLFDRPASAEALAALRAPPGIPELTDALTGLGRVEWARVVSRLRRARLLSQPDRKKSDSLDTHPLVREYFGEQLRRQFPEAWREGNNRLYQHFVTQAPPLPTSLEEMDPLFQAVTFACSAGRERDALHDVYFARIMRGQELYAAYQLGALGPLLSVLSHFFEGGDWGKPVTPGPGRQGLDRADQRRVLLHAGMFHTAAKGFAAPEVGIAFSRAVALSQGDEEVFPPLRGLWSHHLLLAHADARRLAEDLLALAKRVGRSNFLVEAEMAMGLTYSYLGQVAKASEHLAAAVATYRYEEHCHSSRTSGNDPGVVAHAYLAMARWSLGYPDEASRLADAAVALADRVGHPFSKSLALWMHTQVAQFLGDLELTERRARELSDYSHQQGSRIFHATGLIFTAWTALERARRALTRPDAPRPASDAGMGAAIEQMKEALKEYHSTGSMLGRSLYLVWLAEAQGAVGRRDEALALLDEARRLIDAHGDRRWEAELFRVFAELQPASPEGRRAAQAAYEVALRISRQQATKSIELRAATAYARFLAGQGDAERGRALLAEVFGWFREGHGSRDLVLAKALLDELQAVPNGR